MPVNFFEKKCKTHSNKVKFGLCDDPSPSENPAYINETDIAKWIGIVINKSKKEIKFYAIDNCVEITKSKGKMESRCDGILTFDRDIIFVELKSREGGQWLKKGRIQLTKTITVFKESYDMNNFDKIEAYVCNNLRPIAHSGQVTNIQQFKDDTGFVLKGQQVINV